MKQDLFECPTCGKMVGLGHGHTGTGGEGSSNNCPGGSGGHETLYKEPTPDERVMDYLERARKVMDSINYPKSMETEGNHIIEIAKMIQIESNK